MAPLGLPLFEPCRPAIALRPLRTEHEPTALADEPTAVDGQSDPVTAQPELAKLVVAGYAELPVKEAWNWNDMKLHHKRSHIATSGSQSLDRRAR